MADNLTPIIGVIPPIIGTALTLEVMDRLLPSSKTVKKRSKKKLKKVI
jgi:hypothetical protein